MTRMLLRNLLLLRMQLRCQGLVLLVGRRWWWSTWNSLLQVLQYLFDSNLWSQVVIVFLRLPRMNAGGSTMARMNRVSWLFRT